MEERVAALEAQVEEQSKMFIDFRDVLRQMEQRIDTRFTAVDARFEAVDRRFGELEQRLTGLEHRLDARIFAVETGLSSLRETMTSDFRWMVGLQITTAVAVVTAVLAAMASR